MNKWNLQKKELIEERGYECEHCGGDPEHAHHAIMNRKKGVKELNDPRNLILVCRRCHKHGWEYRKRAWRINCERYGRKNMIDWLENIPLINKPTASAMEKHD